MVDGGDGSFKRPGAVPFNWEIRPGVPKTRNPQPDDHTLLHPPKKLPPLRLKPLPPSPSSSSSSSTSQFKTLSVSPFAPPPSFKLESPPHSASHSTGPPTPYWRSSSPRSAGAGDSLGRWRFLKTLVALKRRTSGDVKKGREESTSSESDNFYESETTFSPSEGSSRGSVCTSWGSPKSSFSSRRGSSPRRNQSDLSTYEKQTILTMARDRLG